MSAAWLNRYLLTARARLLGSRRPQPAQDSMFRAVATNLRFRSIAWSRRRSRRLSRVLASSPRSFEEAGQRALAGVRDFSAAHRAARLSLVATVAVHRGPFGEVGSAHDAVLEWCAAHGRRTTGTRWEVYGPHSDDPTEQWVEVYWLIA